MTRKDQIKILDDKIKSNTNQYKVDRLNAEISTFSSCDSNKYEFLTRKDLKYKPNALDKAKFEFSSLGKAFSVGLDKTSQGYKEEGAIKLLKYIRDSLAGVVIRPNRPDNDDMIGLIMIMIDLIMIMIGLIMMIMIDLIMKKKLL